MLLSSPRRCIRIVRLLLLGALASFSIALAAPPRAAPRGKPAQETLKWGDTAILVERADRATADDLQLPIYPGARLHEGYTYRVSIKDGERLSYLASALLTTRDNADRVAQHYSSKLPGRPKPETIRDKTGKRIVLAVAAEREVRSVTIVPKQWGSEIRLTRAVKYRDTPPLPQPEFAPQRSPERGRGARPGPRRGPGRPGRRGGTRV